LLESGDCANALLVVEGKTMTLGANHRRRRAGVVPARRLLRSIASGLAGATAAAATLCWAGAAHAAPYAVTDLGTLGGPTSYARGINRHGQVVGNADTAGGKTHAFLYSNGVMTDLGTLGGANSDAFGINDAGEVVGEAGTGLTNRFGDPITRAFIYSNGAMTDLSLGGTNSSARAINNAGQVVGVADAAGRLGDVTGAFLYSNGTMSSLSTLGGGFSIAWDINDAGRVVGGSDTTGNAEYHAFAYSNGTMSDLGSLVAGNSEALAINASGQTVGRISGATQSVFLYSDGVMTDLGGMSLYNTAYAINASGQIVGLHTNDWSNFRGFLYDGGHFTDINDLIVPGGGWTITQLTDINDAGQVVGLGRDVDGRQHAVLLTPVPEPGPLAAGLGASALLALRRRRG
jgi:probable HAF family extracellular repeat protein